MVSAGGVETGGQSVLRLAEPGPASMLDHLVTGPRAWDRATLAADAWAVALPSRAGAEIAAMAAQLRRAPLPLLLREPGEFGLAACGEAMAAVEQRIADGPGMAIVDRLPMDELGTEEAATVFWLLSQLLERPVATRWDGTMLYDVRDSGRTPGYGVRGSATRNELSFHTDNAFGVALPDYVGLLCIRPGASGGISRCASLYRVHNELLTRHRPLLERLYQPMFYDRQAEHAPDAPRVLLAPLFCWDGRRLSARLTPNLVRRGYEMVGERLDDTLIEALAQLAATLDREDLWIEFALQRGQLQFLDNHWCAHYRSAFSDAADPSLRRHLIRLWLRGQGGRAYDG